MTVDSILDNTSFGTLEVAEQAVVCRLFDDVYKKKQRLALNHKELFKGRKLLPISFEFYSTKLDATNQFAFKYMNPQQIASLEHDLLYAFYVMSAQYQLAAELNLDAAESRRQDRRAVGERIKQCADLIDQLRIYQAPKTPENQHEPIATDHSKQYLAYLGLTTIPSVIAEGIDAINTGSPEALKAWAGEGLTVQVKDRRRSINSPRLYWVWAGGWIQVWIGLLSDYYTHKQAAQQALSAITPYTGFMSFALYLTNASVEILMVAKHTLRGSWMSQGELELSAWERFKAHGDLRKYSIMNDFVWGLGNLACFYWLVGKGTLGYYGNMATAGLLLMDAVLSVFQYRELSKQHEADLHRYDRDISALKRQIRMAVLLDEKATWAQSLATLEKARDRLVFDWKYKTHGLIKDSTYAIVLLLAFVVMTSFLLPPTQIAAATASILGIVGTVLCFVASLTNDAMGGIIERNKSKATALCTKTEFDGLLAAFIGATDANLKKLLYLDMKQSCAIFDRQEAMAHFQMMELIHEMSIKLLVPPLVFVSFIFLPLEMGIGVLAIGFALVVASGRLYMGNKPVLAELPGFNHDNDNLEYEQFERSPTFDRLRLGFFSNHSLASPTPTPADNGAAPAH